MKKLYLNEIDIIRAFAILGVLITHSTSFPAVQLDPSSSLYPLYLALNRFGKLSTPTFIFLSSFVLFYTYYSQQITKETISHFYKRRVTNIVVPYIVWTLFYYILILDGVSLDPTKITSFNWADFGWKLMFGKAAAHLYFVIINIQFYLLFPVFWYVLKRYQNLAKYFFFFGFAIQWIFVLYNNQVLHFPYKGSLALSYFSNYSLGAVAAIYFPTISKWLTEYKVKGLVPVSRPITLIWLLLGLAYTVLFYYGFGYGIWTHSLWYELSWNLYTLWSILVLFYLAKYALNNAPKKPLKLLRELGLASFGIYLVHLVFLIIWEKVSISSEPLIYHSSILVVFLLSLFGSWGIVYLVQKYVPWSWMIFGLKRKQPQATRTTSQTHDI